MSFPVTQLTIFKVIVSFGHPKRHDVQISTSISFPSKQSNQFSSLASDRKVTASPFMSVLILQKMNGGCSLQGDQTLRLARNSNSVLLGCELNEQSTSRHTDVSTKGAKKLNICGPGTYIVF